MKKIAFKIAFIAAVAMCASTAFAQGSINASTVIGGGSFTPSAKVGISISSGDTSYAAASCHLNGTYEYGTVGGSGLTGTFNDASKVYQEAIPSGQTGSVGTPTAQSSATQLQGSNWQ